jgi:hypothetical protein
VGEKSLATPDYFAIHRLISQVYRLRLFKPKLFAYVQAGE